MADEAWEVGTLKAALGRFSTRVTKEGIAALIAGQFDCPHVLLYAEPGDLQGILNKVSLEAVISWQQEELAHPSANE